MKENGPRKKPEMIFLAFAVALVVIVTALVLLLPRDHESSDDDGDDENGKNGPWEDLSEMKREINSVTVFNYREIKSTSEITELEPDTSVYMLIGVEQKITSEERVLMRDYLLEGGHIIIADDGTNAQYLSDFLSGHAGGKVNFTGKRYLVDKLFTDPDDAERGWVYNLSFIKGITSYIGGDIYDLMTHSPNGLEYTGEGTPVIRTIQQLTVIDNNENWVMDLSPQNPDVYTEYGPIAIEYDVGGSGGSILYVSTTGVFTDSILGMEGYENGEFIKQYLYSLIPDGGEIVLDISKQTSGISPHTEVIPG